MAVPILGVRKATFEMLSNFPKATQLVGGEARLQNGFKPSPEAGTTGCLCKVQTLACAWSVVSAQLKVTI